MSTLDHNFKFNASGSISNTTYNFKNSPVYSDVRIINKSDPIVGSDTDDITNSAINQSLNALVQRTAYLKENKVDTNGGTFIGTPTAPTPANNSNNNLVATTEYVDRKTSEYLTIANGGILSDTALINCKSYAVSEQGTGTHPLTCKNGKAYNGMFDGKADVSSTLDTQKANVLVNSWNSIGFKSDYGNNGITIGFNTRTGDIETKGGLNVISNSVFKGKVTSAEFIGNLQGNCSGSSSVCTGNSATATKAEQDLDGNVITEEYLHRAGGTVIGDIDMSTNNLVNLNSIEFKPNGQHGGYLDFHWLGSSADYTSRIIEGANGVLNINGNTFSTNGSSSLNDVTVKTINVTGVLNCTGKANISGALTTTGTITAPKIIGAVWADIAEYYPKGEDTDEGDIIALNTEGKCVKANTGSKVVIGIHSERYAHVIGGEQADDVESYNKQVSTPIALCGRVPVKVIGTVNMGDYIVPYKDGIGRVYDINIDSPLSVIGQAIESNTNTDVKLVMVKVKG